jgi:hypothetical protein
MLQFFREAFAPPRVLIKGNVRLFPGEALAVGTFKDFTSGEEIRLEARTSELAAIPQPGSALVQAAVIAARPESASISYSPVPQIRGPSPSLKPALSPRVPLRLQTSLRANAAASNWLQAQLLAGSPYIAGAAKPE